MKILVKNKKKIVKIGGESVGVFLSKEASAIGWKEGDEVVVAAYEEGRKKGILIERL